MIWYIHLQNKTDRRDDEAIKVDAPDRTKALTVARQHCGTRFTVGSVVRARCSRASDREFLQHLRAMCTKTAKWSKWD